MNREIKFRAWDNGCMQYSGQFLFEQYDGVPFTKDNTAFYPMDGIESGEMITGNVNQDNVFIMQFTGLKDKNGKEIYEGDVLGKKLQSFVPYFFVEWDTKGARWKGIPNDTAFSPNTEQFDIIGNIYENPELIK